MTAVRIGALLLVMSNVVPCEAVTRYVSTTGNDANDGSAESPYRSLKRCTQAPTAPGDTCIVKAGTYTAADQTPARLDIALYIHSSQGSVAGTQANPITLKSEVPLGAVIKVPSVNSGSAGINVSQPYWIVTGFDINGTGITQSTGPSAAQAGVTVNASHVRIEGNHIWDIARAMCNNSAFGQAGLLITNNQQDITVQANTFNRIGRLRDGESGCSTTIHQHDHGVYSAGADSVTITRNVFYDVNRGYAIHVYGSGAVHDNIVVLHNSFSGASPTGSPAGQIMLANTVTNSTIKNNLFHAAPSGYAVNWFSATAFNVEISSNIQDAEDADATNDMQNPAAKPASGVTSTGNIFNATLGLKNTTAGSEDLTLTSSSAAINAGVSVGLAFCGSAPDMGAYETCGPLSATISGATLEVTMAQAFPPVQSNSTGVSLSCSGSGCGSAAVGSVTMKSGSSNIVSIAVTGLPGGVCSSGDTYTVTCSTCGWNDSAKIGGVSNQPTLSFTSFSVTNNCSGSPPPPPTGPIVYYPLNGNATDASGNANHGTATGGSYVQAKYGQGFATAAGTTDTVESPYGSGVNPTTQSLTIVASFFVTTGDELLTQTVMGAALGLDQRGYVSKDGGQWKLAIQGSSIAVGTSDLNVVAGWNRLCLKFDSAADVATLAVNGVTGTGSAVVKSYNSYTFASNWSFGLPPGFATSVAGNTVIDDAKIYNTLVSCEDDWLAWEPASSVAGQHDLKAIRFQAVYLDSAGQPVNFGQTINQAQSVVQFGAVAVLAQIDCANVSPCTGASYQWRYSFDGANFTQVVPNTPTSDGVWMWGGDTDSSLNRYAAVGCPLIGALSCVEAATTTLNSSGTTALDIPQNRSYTIRAIIRIGTPPSGTIYLKPYHANGNALASYVPTQGAMIRVIPPQGSGL